MSNNYAAIIEQNLKQLYDRDLAERAAALPARIENDTLVFRAFGKKCTLRRDGVFLDQDQETGPMGIVISLYALQTKAEPPVFEPFQSFKELPNSMPYVGAFTNRTEQTLVPVVARLAVEEQGVMSQLDGDQPPPEISGDIAFLVKPLPKIALCYVCYQADEDFPPAVTCLYSHNAQAFLTTDALADLGEYTSKTIKEMV